FVLPDKREVQEYLPVFAFLFLSCVPPFNLVCHEEIPNATIIAGRVDHNVEKQITFSQHFHSKIARQLTLHEHSLLREIN
ncbi:hypothetical protein ACGI6H_32410, partial [Escherichia coli]